ncbi:MAG: acyl-CoA dehydrogenase family protein [Polyangiaceae bacterium]
MKLPPSVAPIVEKARKIIDQDVIPLEKEMLARPFREMVPALGALRAKVRDQGLWAPPMPTSYGGMGMSLLYFAHLSEVLGRSPLGHYVFNCQAPDIGNMGTLKAGSEEQKKQWLGPLTRGEIRSCFTADRARAHQLEPRDSATAALDGDHYVVNGHKWFTSSADGAAFAIAMVITHPSAPSPYLREPSCRRARPGFASCETSRSWAKREATTRATPR